MEGRPARGGEPAHHLRRLRRLPGRQQNLCGQWKVLGLDRTQGTYAELVALPVSCLYPFPEGLSEQEAVLTEPLANVVHYFRISMTEVPDSLAVLGAGPIGILTLVLAKLRGIARVVVVDTNEARLDVARRLGADGVVVSGREDPVEAVRRGSDGGAEVVVETAGITATRRQAVAAAAAGGGSSSSASARTSPRFPGSR